MTPAGGLIGRFFDWRAHVITTFFLCCLMWAKFYGVGAASSVPAALAFTSLCAATYTHDRLLARRKSGKEAGGAGFFTLFLSLAPLPYLLYYRSGLVVAYLLIAFIGLAYTSGVSVFGRRIRLKKIFIVKNLASAVSWSAASVLVMAFLAENQLVFSPFVVMFSSVFIIEVLWDVRDMREDASGGVPTIPGVFGVKWAARLVAATALSSILFIAVNRGFFGVLGFFYILSFAGVLALSLRARLLLKEWFSHALVLFELLLISGYLLS